MPISFTVELDSDTAYRVEDLRHDMRLGADSDVFENALALLFWAAREVGRGRIIASIDEGSKQYAELRMECLNAASRPAVRGDKENDRDGPGPS